MEWLDPWWSVDKLPCDFGDSFCRQLAREVQEEHPMHGVPVRLLARGIGDDVLFEFADGTGRVAYVHLTWSKGPERLPWPITSIFDSMEAWTREVMIPQHEEWSLGEE